MRIVSRNNTRSMARIDFLIVFIPMALFIYAQEQLDNPLFSAVGRIFLIFLAFWTIGRRGNVAKQVGLTRPKGLIKTALIGVALMIVGIIVSGIMDQIISVLPGFSSSGSDLSRFENLEGNLPLLIFWLINIWTTIAFGEELIWRGFLTNRLESIFSFGRFQDSVVFVVSATMFGLAHSYQGLYGIAITGFIGLIYVIAYRLLGRNLWALVIAHGLNDTLSIIMLYLGRM